MIISPLFNIGFVILNIISTTQCDAGRKGMQQYYLKCLKSTKKIFFIQSLEVNKTDTKKVNIRLFVILYVLHDNKCIRYIIYIYGLTKNIFKIKSLTKKCSQYKSNSCVYAINYLFLMPQFVVLNSMLSQTFKSYILPLNMRNLHKNCLSDLLSFKILKF